MATRPLYDLLPRNLEFHNLSSVTLSERQSRVLGLGLKFRPSLKPPTAFQFKEQIDDFSRSVRLHYRHLNSKDDPNFNPKLYVKSDWKPPREDPDIEESLHLIREELLQNVSLNKPLWKNNLSKEERAEIHNIKNNDAVRVLGTDKNLGIAVLETDWVKTQTLNHLNDTNSYNRVTRGEWQLRRDKVIQTRERLMTTYTHFLAPNSVKYLRSFDNVSRSLEPAKFYVIPKIHKTPVASRPIAASCSYITRPISVFVDEMVKPVITMPTVLRDSSELIQLLESQVFPKECLLVTADVSALYPNVDTKKALVALDLLLREAKSRMTPFLVQLARLVFENNFLNSEFSPDIFHQSFGIAMGTPFSVTAANAFMYYHEKEIVDAFAQNIALYKRFIDDVIMLWVGSRATLLEFLHALDSKDPRISITYEISETSISFLDLLIYKDPNSSKLQFSTFQKPLNKYLYIPFESFHPSSNKRAFIKGELMRYARNSSTVEAFIETRSLFWTRLRLRGYTWRFLLPLFREIKYSSRNKWLKKRSTASKRDRIVVFKTTYNCSHANIKCTIQKHLPDLPCIVSYKSTATLSNLC